MLYEAGAATVAKTEVTGEGEPEQKVLGDGRRTPAMGRASR